mgnify:CR=1 FL=1
MKAPDSGTCCLASGRAVRTRLATYGSECCAAEQWPEVRRAFFVDVPDLVLLHIDETLLSSPLRWDDVPGAGTFPHIYGPVDLSAVVAVEVLPALDGPSRSPGRRRSMGASTKR